MKKLNKKGFTIVELVVVVAVIAILSAVLIPTVAGVIDKANQSADQAAVRTLNTILSAETPASIAEVKEILAENGYNLKGYTPLANDSKFVWDSEANEIIIVENGVATFPRNRAGEAEKATWFVLASENNFVAAATPETIKSALKKDSVVTIENNLLINESDATLTVKKDLEINLSGASIKAPNDTKGDGLFHVVSGGRLVINATNDSVINGAGTTEWDMAIWADGGDVVINGGYFTNIAEGETIVVGGDLGENHVDLIYAKAGGKVTITGGIFKCKTTGWTLNGNNVANAPGTIVISGGEFFEFDPSADAVMPDGRTCAEDGIVIADGYKVESETRDDGTWYKVVAE